MTLFENEPKLTNHQFKIKGNKIWHLTQEYYDELKDTYPLHDVEGEMRAAKLWCKNVSASKRKTAKGMVRFLSGWVSRSEATGFVTVDAEKSPAQITYEKNVREKIELFSNVIHERTKSELRANKTFMYAYSTYPEFREWAGKQTYKTATLPPFNLSPILGDSGSEPEPRIKGKDLPSTADVAGTTSLTDKAASTTTGPGVSSASGRTNKIVSLFRDAERYRDNNPEKFSNLV
jgi:hypothetical protein